MNMSSNNQSNITNVQTADKSILVIESRDNMNPQPITVGCGILQHVNEGEVQTIRIKQNTLINMSKLKYRLQVHREQILEDFVVREPKCPICFNLGYNIDRNVQHHDSYCLLDHPNQIYAIRYAGILLIRILSLSMIKCDVDTMIGYFNNFYTIYLCLCGYLPMNISSSFCNIYFVYLMNTIPYTGTKHYPTVSQFKELMDSAIKISSVVYTKDQVYNYIRILSIPVSRLQDSGYMKVLIESGLNPNQLPAINVYSLVVNITHMYLMKQGYCNLFDSQVNKAHKETVIDLITKTINRQTQMQCPSPIINRMYIDTLYHLNLCGLYTQRVLEYQPEFVSMDDE